MVFKRLKDNRARALIVDGIEHGKINREIELAGKIFEYHSFLRADSVVIMPMSMREEFTQKDVKLLTLSNLITQRDFR